MGSISLWMFLVLTICTWNKTIGCTWMSTQPPPRSMFHVFSNYTITMLEKMGDEVSPKCLMNFPDELYRQVDNFNADDQIAFISQTLNKIMKLYSSDKYESTASDQKGFYKSFMTHLERQTSELDRCEYSASSWEDIRTVVLRHLGRLDTTD
ncbi:interferon a3-like [Coregonus clupeaformis]|uniref:interferon a3-like n=1 Tax=Coregonus clupeaformis TaxID=59861 RepID=UPI001E1C34A5|nr:interferon a3-like [Coregonus clupeaformis]